MKAEFCTKNSIANVIRIFRISRDLSLAELSALTGLKSSYLSEVESGSKKPTYDNIKKIAKALDVPYAIIVYFDEQQSEKGFSYRKLLLRILAKIEQLEIAKNDCLNESDDNFFIREISDLE